MHYVYMVECKDGTLYTGWTTDIAQRLEQHNKGKGAKYTRARRPVVLKYYEELASKEEALKREYHLRHLSRKEKLRLIDQAYTSLG